MIVRFEDKDYEFDIEGMTVSEARYIKKVTGFSIRGLIEGMSEVDPDALVAAYWLMQKQNGVVVDMNKVDFALLKFGEALNDAFAAEDKENEGADPTEAVPAAKA